MKDHSQYKSFGLYGGGVLGQPLFNIPAFFKLFGPTRFNVFTTFVMDVWNNLGSYPWKFIANIQKFDLDQWNEPWWVQLKLLFLEAAKVDTALDLCLFTDYQSLHWRRMIEFPKCPLTDNTYGIHLADETDSHLLYTNWNRQDPTDIKNFAWLFWKADAHEECIMDQTKPANKMGAALIRYINRFADTAKAAHDESLAAGFIPRLYLRCVNEATARHSGRSLELDSRIQSFVRQTMLSRGFAPPLPGKPETFRMVNEDEVFISGTQRDYQQIIKNQRWCDDRGFLIEQHGCDADEINRLLSAQLNNGTKMNPLSLICSMDGVPDLAVPAEAKKINLMMKKGIVKKASFKVPDQYGPNQQWQRRNLNANMVTAVPQMNALLV